MAVSSGTRVQFAYIEEAVRGTTPASPTLKILRTTSRTINLEKDILESEEVRSDREVSDVRHGLNRVVGSPAVQLGTTDYDDILRFALGGVWRGATTGLTTLSAAGANSITRATGSFHTDGFRPGDLFRANGWATNPVGNFYRIASIAADGLSLTTTADSSVLNVEAGGGDEHMRLFGNWNASAGTATGQTITASASGSTFTRSAGDYIADGLRVGDTVHMLLGHTAPKNNGPFVITALTPTVATVYPSPTDEAGDGNEQMYRYSNSGYRLDIGTTLYTMTAELQFLDIIQYKPFQGTSVGKASLSVQPESMVTAVFELLGMSSSAMAGSSISGSAPTAAGASEPFAAFDADLYEAGSPVAVATGIDLSVDNGRSLEGVVGSKFSPDVFEGRAHVGGSIVLFLQDAAFYNKFFNETGTNLWLMLWSQTGTQFLNIVMNKFKLVGAPIDPPQEGPVPIASQFEALKTPATSTTPEYPSLSLHRSTQ